jgi:cell fate regulator YaaT (PSP1 superfamily)
MGESYTYFVGVRFPGTNKSYYFGTNLNDLKLGDKVVVETISGYEIGSISTASMSAAAYNSSLGTQADSPQAHQRRHGRLQSRSPRSQDGVGDHPPRS